MKYILNALIWIVLGACASYDAKVKSSEWAYYERWDQNDDLSLTEGEFTSSYVSSNFFSRWARNGNSISVAALCDSAFKILDTSGNALLDSTELFSRKAYYMVGDSIPGITTVDANTMTKPAFEERICRRQMAQQFDKSQDQVVSEAEMADAMFAICDTDDDGAVNSLEFYLWQVHRK